MFESIYMCTKSKIQEQCQTEILCSTPLPVGWGSRYCFTDIRLGVFVGITPITKGIPAQIFFGGMFFVPWGF